MSTTPATPAPRGGLWRQPDFAKLWTAETISQFGSQVSALAIPLVAILLLNASPFEVALLGTVEFLPFILISLPAGVWVDRLRRRPILIIGDLGRALALATIPIAHVLHVLTIYQLYVVGFVTGVLTVFFDVAYQSYLPSLVDREHLVEGNAKLDISRSGAQLAGPGVGGFLIGAVTAPIAIVADALSFVGSALFVLLIRRDEPAPERHPSADGKGPGMRREVADGLRYVLGNPYLRHIAASTGSSNLFSSIAFSTFLVYVVRNLGLTPAEIGLVFGLSNIGFLIGAVSASRIAARFGVGWTIISSMFLGGPSVLLIAIAPRDLAIPLIFLGFGLGGFSSVVYNVNQVSLRQAITPDRMQGRMNATMRFIVWGTLPIGSLIGGVLGTVVGLQQTLFIGAIGSFLPFLAVFFSPVREIRTIPSGPPDPDAAIRSAFDADAGGVVTAVTGKAPAEEHDPD